MVLNWRKISKILFLLKLQTKIKCKKNLPNVSRIQCRIVVFCLTLFCFVFFAPGIINISYIDYEFQSLVSKSTSQFDNNLIEWVHRQIMPPSKDLYNLNYFLSGLHEEFTVLKQDSYSPSQEFIIGTVEELFHDKEILRKPKTFLEAGAYDGEFLSNTLAFEKYYGWKGLLVEANPRFFAKLLTKNRKAHAINVCLSHKTSPSIELFFEVFPVPTSNHMINSNKSFPHLEANINMGSSALLHIMKDRENKNLPGVSFSVRCVPLYSVMAAAGLYHVTFLSLDLEGAELDVLASLPWDKVSFEVLVIEYKSLVKLKDFLEPRGYIHYNSKEIDHIFVNPSSLHLSIKKRPKSDINTK